MAIETKLTEDEILAKMQEATKEFNKCVLLAADRDLKINAEIREVTFAGGVKRPHLQIEAWRQVL